MSPARGLTLSRLLRSDFSIMQCTTAPPLRQAANMTLHYRNGSGWIHNGRLLGLVVPYILYPTALATKSAGNWGVRNCNLRGGGRHVGPFSGLPSSKGALVTEPWNQPGNRVGVPNIYASNRSNARTHHLKVCVMAKKFPPDSFAAHFQAPRKACTPVSRAHEVSNMWPQPCCLSIER